MRTISWVISGVIFGLSFTGDLLLLIELGSL